MCENSENILRILCLPAIVPAKLLVRQYHVRHPKCRMYITITSESIITFTNYTFEGSFYLYKSFKLRIFYLINK